jgi:hydroxypyruvate isomerase
MPHFAANLGFLLQEFTLLERFAAAARLGFRGVEMPFPYDHPADVLAARLRASDLTQVLFNLWPGDWSAGERGLAALPGREQAFAESLERALPYARALACERLHAMAGIPPAEAPRAACEAVYIQNLRWAAETLQPHGIRLLIEPINNRRDMPGYFLNTPDQARQIIERVGSDNLLLQMDLYHCQVMQGDLAEHIRTHFAYIGHVQIAGNPGRHEPDVGEIAYPYLFDLLDDLGYAGWIGCEYHPQQGTLAGLGWARRYGLGETRPGAPAA